MSGWLHHLIRQSRAVERTVRPATSAYRGPALAASAAESPLESEAFVPAQAADRAGDAARPIESRVQPGSSVPDADHSRRRIASGEHASPGKRQTRRDIGENLVAPPMHPAPRRLPEANDSAPVHDLRSRIDSDGRQLAAAPPVRAPADGAPRPHSEASTTTIRPSSRARVDVAVRAAAGEPPAPVPDVHIHIGRLELTALTAAPAPRREPAAAAHRPMSLDEYLRRRNGGER